MNNSLKILQISRAGIKKILSTAKFIKCKEKPIIAVWWQGAEGKNWGDALNPILIEKISGKEVISHKEIFDFKQYERYAVIGSILGFYSIDNLVVWGSGFISATSKFKKEPKRICAVRGPLTRDLILKQGIDCPEVYGDPALLYPLFYQPYREKKYELGFIPHYKDKNNPIIWKFKEKYPEVHIIDITEGINKVIDDIQICEKIASSSLHGIIAADAYKIPSLWVKFSEDIVTEGDEFKFRDYYLSVGRDYRESYLVKENSTLDEVMGNFNEYRIKIDLTNLVNSCPFINESRKDEIKREVKRHSNR